MMEELLGQVMEKLLEAQIHEEPSFGAPYPFAKVVQSMQGKNNGEEENRGQQLQSSFALLEHFPKSIFTCYIPFQRSRSQESNTSNRVRFGAEMRKIWPSEDNCSSFSKYGCYVMAWMQSHGNFSHPEVISYELLEGEVFNSKFFINPLEPISMAIERIGSSRWGCNYGDACFPNRWLPKAISSSFQLQIVHGLKRWILDFQSFEMLKSQGDGMNRTGEVGKMKSQPNALHAKAGMYTLNEDVDMKAKFAAMTRRVEELELKKMHEVQAVAETPVQVKPCSICQSYEHLVEECPTIPVAREMFGEQANVIGQFKPNSNASYGNTYNSSWRNHPNFSWKPRAPQYQQPAQPSQPSQQASSLEQAIVNLSKVVGDFVGDQKSINSQLSQRIDSVENTLNKRMDGMQNDLSQKIDNLQYSISRLTNLNTVQEKGRFPSQPHQNPKGIHEVETHEGESSQVRDVKALITLRSGKKVESPTPKPYVEEKEEEETKKREEMKGKKKDISERRRTVIQQGLNVNKKAFLTEQVSAIIQCKSPLKYKDPGCPTISVMIGGKVVEKALLDLGASVNLLPYSVYKQLGLGELKPTSITLSLADRPFLATSNAIINCRNGLMQLTFGNMTLELNIFHMSKKLITPEEEEGPEEVCIIDTLVEEHCDQNMQDELNESLEDLEEGLSEPADVLATLQGWRGKKRSYLYSIKRRDKMM
ncbi:hypothetical protein CK203_066521 [Vitis vinifera]|uniref:Retrotransposon gag domain-containing protein n=1 Tax=Vitis vinifera TaxID=29760 RepID=A0A438G2D3_VITVI|nr:hypothetical protein CK203_066521 [Vitis vinifera]